MFRIADITAVFSPQVSPRLVPATQKADDYGMATSNSRKLYLSCPSKSVPCPQILGYTLGKTLGSGKFAKVKAAWSPYEGRMVRSIAKNYNFVNFLYLFFQFLLLRLPSKYLTRANWTRRM